MSILDGKIKMSLFPSRIHPQFFVFFRWKEAVESTSFENIQTLFDFVVKFKNPGVKGSFDEIQPLTYNWISPTDMSDALFEVRLCMEWISVVFAWTPC